MSFQTNTVLVTCADFVYVTATNTGSCASYLSLPVSILGLQYEAITWSFVDDVTATSSLIVLALSDKTNVVIRLPVHLAHPVKYGNCYLRGGDVIAARLSAYETLSLNSNADLSGTGVAADQPVAVYTAGSEATIGPGNTTDQTLSQLLPTSAWGRKFIILGIPENIGTGFYLKITSGMRDASVTCVTARWNRTFNVTVGQAAVIDSENDSNLYIISDVDIQVKGHTILNVLQHRRCNVG